MTLRLYDRDAYLSAFSAAVCACTPGPDGSYHLVLSQSCFFPEAGGQDADTGVLTDEQGESQPVLYVFEENGELFHRVAKPYKPGQTVSGRIDFSERFRKMQNHTGEHIVSGLIHTIFGYKNVGFHLGTEVTVDCSGELNRDQADLVEQKANEAVWADLPVTVAYPDPEELAAMPYRSKLDLTENVRIVTVPGVDMCACCAPHVATTGQIGAIRILDMMRYKGGTRLRLCCGKDALAVSQDHYKNVAAIAASLSVQQHRAFEAVTRLLQEHGNLKLALKQARNAWITCKAEALPKTEGSHIVFEEALEPALLGAFADCARSRCGQLCAVFSGSDKEGYRFAVACNKTDPGAVLNEMRVKLSARGGGKDLLQGTVSATAEEIRSFFA